MKRLTLQVVLALAATGVAAGPIALAKAVDSPRVANQAASQFAAEVCAGPEVDCVSSGVEFLSGSGRRRIPLRAAIQTLERSLHRPDRRLWARRPASDRKRARQCGMLKSIRRSTQR